MTVPVPAPVPHPVPPGWYPDPVIPGQQRWWNGFRWTDEVATANQPPAASWTGASFGPRVVPAPTALSQQQPPLGSQTTAVTAKRNPHSRAMAIACLFTALGGGILAITAIVTGPLAIIFGCVAISRARAQGERMVMATWGIVIGALTFIYAVRVLAG